MAAGESWQFLLVRLASHFLSRVPDRQEIRAQSSMLQEATER